MPSRDVEINLIGNDHTGAATRSAGKNLDQLARKIDKFNAKSIGGDKNNRGTDPWIAAQQNAEKLERKLKKKKFVVRAGLDPQFVRDIKNIPNFFATAGTRARARFKRAFGSPGVDPQFVRDINRISTFFSTAGARSRAAFKKGLGSPGLDAQFVNDVKKIPAFFSRAGVRSRTAFQSALGRLRVNAATAKIKQVFKVDRDARLGGITAGGVFFRSFINTVTFGMAGGQLSAGMIKAAPKMAAVGATLGGVVAAVMVTEIAQALSAAASLFIGGGLLAGPIAFLLVQQAKASKETVAQEKRVAALRKRLNNAATKDTRDRIQKQLTAEQRVLDEMRKQSQQWDNIKTKAKSFMTTISAPLKVPLQKSIQAMFDGLNNLKGPVREIMAQLGTALPGLTAGVFAGLLSFVNALKPAIPNVVAGLNEWGRVMPQITASVGTLLARLTAHPEAVQGFADSFDTFLGSAGDVIVKLQGIASEYGKLEALIRGGRTGKWGDEWTKTSGKTRTAANVISRSQHAILTKYDDWLQKIRAVPGSPFEKYKNEVHQARLAMDAEFNKMIAAKKKVDTAFAGAPSIAQLDADDTDFKAKIINAKKQLRTVKSEKARVKILADISQWRLARSTIRADKHIIQKSTKTVLRGDAKDLKAKIAQMKRDIKNLPKEKRFEAKAKIAAAEAAVRRLQGEINQLHGKSVDIWIKTHRATYYSVHGNKGHVPTNPKGDGHPSAGPSWQAALTGGATSRTTPPTVNVAAPEINTRVIIDGRDVRATALSTVIDENRRNTWRARVGRR